MARNTSITLGAHFDEFIAHQVGDGRYGSASEVVRAGLRLLENNETKLKLLRGALHEGEQSGFVEYSYDSIVADLSDIKIGE